MKMTLDYQVDTDTRRVQYEGVELLRVFNLLAVSIKGLTDELRKEREESGVAARLAAAAAELKDYIE